MKERSTFEQHLRKANLADNTIQIYLWTVEYYHAHYDAVSKENLLAYNLVWMVPGLLITEWTRHI